MTESPPSARPAVNGELLSRVQQLRLNNQLGAGAKSAGGGATWLPWLLCGMLALAWAGYAVRGYRNAPTTTAVAPAASADRPADATTSTSTAPAPAAAAGSIQVEVKGYLTPAQQIAVSPIDVGGRLVETHVIEGKQFKKGEVLGRIDDTVYQAQVLEAQAAVAGAEKRLDVAKMRLAALDPKSVRPVEREQMQAELTEAEAQRDRIQDQVTRLTRIGGTSVSEQEARQARFDLAGAVARVGRLRASLEILNVGPRPEQLRGAEADVKAAEADVKAAQARLKQAEWRTQNCVILAPIDGTVLSKKAELGNLVNPMAFSASSSGGGALCDMANLADLEVELKIAEKDIRKVKVGQPTRIRADAYPDQPYTGRVDRIMPIANLSDNTIYVRVKVQLPPGEVPGTYLKPQMSAVVSLLSSGQ